MVAEAFFLSVHLVAVAEVAKVSFAAVVEEELSVSAEEVAMAPSADLLDTAAVEQAVWAEVAAEDLEPVVEESVVVEELGVAVVDAVSAGGASTVVAAAAGESD